MEVPELEGRQEPGRGPAQLLQSLPSASPSAPVAPRWTSGTGCLGGRGVGMGKRQEVGRETASDSLHMNWAQDGVKLVDNVGLGGLAPDIAFNGLCLLGGRLF